MTRKEQLTRLIAGAQAALAREDAPVSPCVREWLEAAIVEWQRQLEEQREREREDARYYFAELELAFSYGYAADVPPRRGPR